MRHMKGGLGRVLVVQMERQAYLEQLSLGGKVACYCDDPAQAIQELLEALARRFPLAAGGLPTFLVAARIDRGGTSVSDRRIEQLRAEFAIDEYFETSAFNGTNTDLLRSRILAAIDWERIPKITSTALFDAMKRFVVDQQPELLDAYASAIVNAARDEPDGLGSILESRVIDVDFPVSAVDRVPLTAGMEESADRGRASEAASTVLRGKEEVAEFDVFLCHNVADKPAVRVLAEQLRGPGAVSVAGRARAASWPAVAAAGRGADPEHPGGDRGCRHGGRPMARPGTRRVLAAVRPARVPGDSRAATWGRAAGAVTPTVNAALTKKPQSLGCGGAVPGMMSGGSGGSVQ